MTARALLSRFRRQADGMAAIEAAMVFPMFFLMVMMTFEIGWVFYRTATVETVAVDAARMVLTGRAPAAGVKAGAKDGECQTGSACFYEQICARVEMFGDCDENLSVEVRTFETMAEVTEYYRTAPVKCKNSPGYDTKPPGYEPGDRDAYSFVRLCFLADTFNPLVGSSLADGPDGKKAIVAVQIRRNEPYLADDQINPNEVQE